VANPTLPAKLKALSAVGSSAVLGQVIIYYSMFNGKKCPTIADAIPETNRTAVTTVARDQPFSRNRFGTPPPKAKYVKSKTNGPHKTETRMNCL
jgi:hypothetical protein